MKNSKESCNHDFFQNYCSSSLETGSSNHLRNTTDGNPAVSQKDPPSNSSLEQEEHEKDDSSDLSSLNDFSSPSTVENVHRPAIPLPPILHRL